MTSPAAGNTFEILLDYLKSTRGFDFTGYKRTGLARRFKKRMQMIGIKDYAAYRDYLELHPDEFISLFNSILINVTAFFRDQPAWDYLTSEIIPLIIKGKEAKEPIRVWTAGCASGEEAYTLAIVFSEALGTDAFRQRVKIYATDVDEEALSHARHGAYGAREVTGIPEPLLEKYFERSDSRYVFNREIRRNIIFGRNDLVQDAPISRIDLLTCRNTLMYLNADLQQRILSRFHFALNDGGFLFLGKAEMLFSHSQLFHPRDLKWRVFTKISRRSFRDRMQLMIRPQLFEEIAKPTMTPQAHIREVVFDAGSVAQVVIDVTGHLTLVNEQARGLFRINPNDLGRPFQDLELSYQPAELRSLIERVHVEKQPVSIKEIRWPTVSGEPRTLDVLVMPLLDETDFLLGVSITFSDITPFKQLQGELEQTNRELEVAYEDLQSTNEELETTNEELQSINEELETTNEELQSSNEELETMNEELQATNEEMHTINEEMRLRGEELDQLNNFMNSILTSLRGAVAVIGPEMEVQVWSPRAENLWGLRAEEVIGKHFLNLDIGLPVDQLRQPIRAALSGDEPQDQIILDATNRRGKPIRCQVSCTRLYSDTGITQGVILLMEDVELPIALNSA